MKNFTLALATASLGVAGIVTPAFANPVETKTERVSYEDLDLTTKAGQLTLDRRVNAAAERVCNANLASTSNRLRSSETRKCMTKARASARQQVASAVQQKRFGG